MLWSGCRQLFTSVTQPRYTQFSDALKRRTDLELMFLKKQFTAVPLRHFHSHEYEGSAINMKGKQKSSRVLRGKLRAVM